MSCPVFDAPAITERSSFCRKSRCFDRDPDFSVGRVLRGSPDIVSFWSSKR